MTKIPSEHRGLIPHLVCSNASEAIDFYTRAFGAVETFRLPTDDGRLMHAEVRIDGHALFLVDDFPEMCDGKLQNPTALGGTPVTIHRPVEDCDAAFARAVDAGASVMLPPTDMFWGDRYAVVIDPFGHHWSLAHPLKQLSAEEVRVAMQEAFMEAEGGKGSAS